MDLDGTPQLSWQAQAISADQVVADIAEDLDSSVEVWTNATSILQQLYLKEDTASTDTSKTTDAVREAWATANNGKCSSLS